jgi:hypothetical protein
MVSIEEYLTRLGVDFNAHGKMRCPKCSEDKMTASTKKDIAKCWHCGLTLVPNRKNVDYCLAWHHVVMNRIAEACKNGLTSSSKAYKWLTETRKLPADLEWLRSNSLGVWVETLPLKSLETKAREQLDETTKRALASVEVDDDKARGLLNDEHDRQKKCVDGLFKDTLPKMLEGGLAGWVTYVYENYKGDCTSIHIRKPSAEEKMFSTLQPNLGERGLFNPRNYQGRHWEKLGLMPLVVEGEHNWLSLLARKAEWGTVADEWAIAGCAMGGKAGIDAREYMKTFPDEYPWVLYDNDAKGDDGMAGGFDMVKSINDFTPLFHSTTWLAKDLDELVWSNGINSPRLSEKELLKMWDRAEYSPRPYAVVGKQVNKALGGKPGRTHIANSSTLLWEDIQMRGDVYKVATSENDSFAALVLWDVNPPLKTVNRVVQVHSEHSSWLSLMRQYGVGASDSSAEKLRKEVAQLVRDSDAPTKDIYVFSHYDRDTKCLYVDEKDRVLKLCPDGSVRVLQNGDDGILFTQAGDARKADLALGLGSLRIKPNSLLDKYILSSVNWDDTGELKPVSAKHLYKHHIISMSFDSLLQAKVCPVFMGVQGGGKNTITNLTGMLFQGKDFCISPFPKSAADLDTLTVDKIYVGFDEYDASKETEETAFRSWCTRMFSSRRQLFCTWDISKRPLARGMGLSCNDNPVRDVASGRRQLMFNILGRQTETEEAYASLGGKLIPEFLSHRNEIWSEIVADLRAMVVHLANDDISQKYTNFRMSDFATLFLVGADCEGWGSEAREMLNQMIDLQVSQVASKHTIVDCMKVYLSKNFEARGTYKTLKEWGDALRQEFDGDNSMVQKLTQSSFIKLFAGANKDIMVQEFGMKVAGKGTPEYDTHAKQHAYALWLPNEPCLDDLMQETGLDRAAALNLASVRQKATGKVL